MIVAVMESTGFEWKDLCEAIAGLIAWIGVAVLTYGVVRAAWCFIQVERRGSQREARNQLRMDLGYYVLLALEILVAADVIETLTAPNLEHVLVLGIIVLIRTVISFSLNWELAQERKQDDPARLPESAEKRNEHTDG